MTAPESEKIRPSLQAVLVGHENSKSASTGTWNRVIDIFKSIFENCSLIIDIPNIFAYVLEINITSFKTFDDV